jgi:hypothetical protein
MCGDGRAAAARCVDILAELRDEIVGELVAGRPPMDSTLVPVLLPLPFSQRSTGKVEAAKQVTLLTTIRHCAHDADVEDVLGEIANTKPSSFQPPLTLPTEEAHLVRYRKRRRERNIHNHCLSKLCVNMVYRISLFICCLKGPNRFIAHSHRARICAMTCPRAFITSSAI